MLFITRLYLILLFSSSLSRVVLSLIPAPINCDDQLSTKFIDNKYFYKDPLNIQNLNLTYLNTKRYFFFGNSVNRHYAFSLKDILQGHSNDTNMDRITEKASCVGELGTASCALYPVSSYGQTEIIFGWKYYIGVDESFEDPGRDICVRQLETLSCLKKIFINATVNDVIIIGSVISNTSHFRDIGGCSGCPFGVVHKQFLDSANEVVAHQVLHMMMEAFPGVIIWHSFPHLRLANYNEKYDGDTNDFNNGFEYIDSLVKCGSVNYDRVLFVDLRKDQKLREADYRDLIHHPGAMSMDYVNLMLSYLK